MGGSGGGTYAVPRNVEGLQERARQEAQQQSLTAEVNALLAEKLAVVNSRDVEKVGEYLDEAVAALGDRVEDVTQLLYGGSVAKHTYVDGLSDVDALVLLSGSPTSDPSDVRDQFAQALRESLPRSEVAEVRVGSMAVTITYRDGTEIQLLPAIRRGDQTVAIPSEDGQEWQSIMPRRFARALTRVNQAQGQLVVPTIKLAKTILASQSEQAVSGYHVEALAVAAFRDYEGPRNLRSTVQHLFESAASNVMRPIRDTTGQSEHLDEALGPAGSSERRRLAAVLRRIGSQLEAATSVERWGDLLGDSQA